MSKLFGDILVHQCTKPTNIHWTKNFKGLNLMISTMFIRNEENYQVWQLNLELLPRNPHGKAGNEKRPQK